MKYKLLGRTGVQVSQLCFGTMSFGGDADEPTSAAMYKAVRDAGINFFDTANEYNKGVSEEILGRLAKEHRNDLVITTKVNAQIRPDLNARGTSRRHMIEAIEGCLRRLQTDRIDVLFLHRYDALVPIEESMRGLEDLVRAGKVIYPAVSNWSAWQTQRAVDLQERNNWARLQVIQPMYSLVKRQAEVEILPMAEHNGIGVIPYSPAAAGLLSGKYFGQASGRLQDQQDVRGALRRGVGVRDGGEVRRPVPGQGPASGERGDRLGGGASRDHRADHRRAQSRPAQGLAGIGRRRDDSGAAQGDRRPLAHARRRRRIAWKSRRSWRGRYSLRSRPGCRAPPPDPAVRRYQQDPERYHLGEGSRPSRPPPCAVTTVSRVDGQVRSSASGEIDG